jgi:4-aminobutyrate aminotransferase-like enzyme
MKKTLATRMAEDPRIIQAQQVILDTLAEYQGNLVTVQAAIPELKQSYDEAVNEFGGLRGAPLYYAYLGSGLGKGALVELADGSVKYDFISGIGVHHFGHSNPKLVQAQLRAALRDTVMQGNLQQNVESLELARTLVAAANRYGATLKHCFFSTSGAMANENALKVIFQKKHPADRILAFDGCFSGRTLALCNITDKAAYREGLPSLLHVDYVPFFDETRPAESTKMAVETLHHHLKRYPGRHAAMCMELVLGEGGFHPGSREFFVPILETLKEHSIAVLFDEIQTFSRTSELFAFQHFGLDEYADVVTIGKSAQICATLFRDEYNPRPGLLSQTFTGATSALFAARVIVDELIQDDYFGVEGKIARLHDHCVSRFSAIEARHPDLIAGPYGIGAMVAFTPLGGGSKEVQQFVHALFDAGVIGFYAGSDPTRARFLLPVGAVTFEDIDRVAAIVEETLVNMGE